jgi:hypothetical protein
VLLQLTASDCSASVHMPRCRRSFSTLKLDKNYLYVVNVHQERIKDLVVMSIKDERARPDLEISKVCGHFEKVHKGTLLHLIGDFLLFR